MGNSRRKQLIRIFRFSVLLATFFVVYVLIDYSFNQVVLDREYRFEVPALSDNQPVILNQGSMIIVVAHYNADIINHLSGKSGGSSRIDSEGYFVALAYGTDLGCPVKIVNRQFNETCSTARYDLLGQSLDQDAYKSLEIPLYRWNKNFTALTIYQE